MVVFSFLYDFLMCLCVISHIYVIYILNTQKNTARRRRAGTLPQGEGVNKNTFKIHTVYAKNFNVFFISVSVFLSNSTTNELNLCFRSVNSWSSMRTIQILRGFHRKGLTHLAFSPDGEQLLTVGADPNHCIAVYVVSERKARECFIISHTFVFQLRQKNVFTRQKKKQRSFVL